jgi:hypothetical protein
VAREGGRRRRGGGVPERRWPPDPVWIPAEALANFGLSNGFCHRTGKRRNAERGAAVHHRTVTKLVSAGILVAPVLLHTGVSSPESGEPPLSEHFPVPVATARIVDWVRAEGGRVIAVGTTVARALESAARPDGSVAPSDGWTDLVLGPGRPARVVDGLISGLLRLSPGQTLCSGRMIRR